MEDNQDKRKGKLDFQRLAAIKSPPGTVKIKPKSYEDVDKMFGKNRKPVTDATLIEQWLACKKSAENRGLEFSLSLKRLRQVVNTKHCKYTGELIHYNPDKINYDSGHIGSLDFLSLERMDSEVGYTDKNVIAVGTKINILKSNITPEQIIKLAKALEKQGFGPKRGRKKKK